MVPTPKQAFLGVMGMGAECEVGEGKEKKVLEQGRCCAALQTPSHRSPAEEVSPSQSLLSLQHNALPQGTVLGKSASEGCLS